MSMIKSHLYQYNKKTMTLDQLTHLIGSVNQITTYDAFYEKVMSLMEEGILIGIKAAGSNGLAKPLPNKFRVNKIAIHKDKSTVINHKQLQLHPSISLDYYYAKGLEEFQRDEVYIDKVNDYVKANGLPIRYHAPELSYILVQDEKWIENGVGKRLLKHIRLWDQLEVVTEADPLAFGVNKHRTQESVQRHLIIENKTTFLHLLQYVDKSEYNTIIYGQGWKITSGLHMFTRQYPFGDQHSFDYFGDLDNEGIAIFLHLREDFPIQPAEIFYNALIQAPWSKGKETQRHDPQQIQDFCACFSDGDGLGVKTEELLERLSSGYYQPQEVLSIEGLVQLLEKEHKDDKL